MTETSQEERATFTELAKSTQAEWDIISKHLPAFAKGLPHRVLDHLKLLEGDFSGMPVDRLEHCLQTATRAYRDGRDTEYVVCALLHDIGDTLGAYNHAEIAATILKPFISEKNHWLLTHHGIFQGYYTFEFLGLDKNMREKFKDHPYYKDGIEFCALYDQKSFDPSYDSLPLETFVPMVVEVMSKPKSTIYKGIFAPLQPWLQEYCLNPPKLEAISSMAIFSDIRWNIKVS